MKQVGLDSLLLAYLSPPSRAAWIETRRPATKVLVERVAALAGGVD